MFATLASERDLPLYLLHKKSARNRISQVSLQVMNTDAVLYILEQLVLTNICSKK